uniref:Uncharacterized protein n=1 Tax=Ditylenchus dipsaci TaxID=166011 RepID=A0A915EEM1_9BILA
MIAGGFGNDVFETRAALDAICGGSGTAGFNMGDGSGFGEEDDFTEFSDSKLEELLQLSQFHADSMQKPPFQSSRSALAQQLSQNNGNGYPNSKRRKMSHLQPANFTHPIASALP